MIKGSLRFLALLALALGALFAVPAVATAHVPPSPSATASPGPDCRVVVVTLADRPDSGNHGTWATDQITRTAKVCHQIFAQAQADNATWHYTATVVDDGHFITVAGGANSPNKGVAIGHVVPGYLGGQFTATFTAPGYWRGWLGKDWTGKTLTGPAGSAANPTTSTYVKALWKYGFEGSALNNDWTWTYWTCSKSLAGALERWTDDYKTDGQGKEDGDITGKPCPTPSPVPTTAGATPSTPAGLPVTGARTDLLAGGAVVVLAAGGAALWLGRRRRTRFEA